MAADTTTGAALTHGSTSSRPRLHYVTAGSGPAVFLLHGFPEYWYGWRHQIGPLAAAGHRVIVPDQRGYHLSEKPPAVCAYRLDELAADVLRLAGEVVPGERIALVGHDWGAAVAWWVAIHHPERLGRLAILNVPHPSAMRRGLARSPRQWLRSWYILLFQLPRLPEWLLRRNHWKAMNRALRASSRPGTFTAQDLARYREAWAQPGALTAMLNWYRALLRYPPRWRRGLRVAVPALMLWGVHDVALGRELAAASRAHCDDGRLVYFESATHWLHHEEPARVNDLLLRFLAGGTAAVPAT